DTGGDSGSLPLTSCTPADSGAMASVTTTDDDTGDGDTSGGHSSRTDTAGSPGSSTPTATAGHVFVIALTTPSYRAAFGAGSVAHYLNHKLRPQGVLLSGYRTPGGSELPDYVAM